MIFSDITINYKFNGIGYTLSIVAGVTKTYLTRLQRLCTVLSNVPGQTYESLSTNLLSIFHPKIPKTTNFLRKEVSNETMGTVGG